MPPFNAVCSTMGIPLVANSLPVVKNFLPIEPFVAAQMLTISGTTKDSAGAAKANATVYLFAMNNGMPLLVNKTISNAAGFYTFFVSAGQQYWITDYKVGPPDLAGATLQTLTGV